MKRRPKPGERVRYTDAFWHSVDPTYRPTPEEQAGWTVVACSCAICRSGLFVASDETFAGGIARRHLEVSGLVPVGGAS